MRGAPTSSFDWSALLVAGSRALVWLVTELTPVGSLLLDSAAASLCALGVLTGSPCGFASTVC